MSVPMSAESVPRVVVALAMGLCSGVLLFFTAVWLLGETGMGTAALRTAAWTAMLGGWALSTAWMLRRRPSVGTVVQRGLLLSTVEWGLVTVLGVAFGAGVAGEAISTGAVEAGILTGGFAVVAVLAGAGGMTLISVGALLLARHVGKRRRAAELSAPAPTA
jgi:hypothetical protein